MTSKNIKNIKITDLTAMHEIRIHDSYHELVDGLALYYSQIAKQFSKEEFVKISTALTGVKGVTVTGFAGQISLPEELITQWLAGEAAPDDEFRKMVIEKLFQFARKQIHPCSPKYQYPGATICGCWVLPVEVTLCTKLQELPCCESLTEKYQQAFVDLNINTVGEYLEDPEALRKVNGIGWDRSEGIKRTLLGGSGFRKIDQKLLFAS